MTSQASTSNASNVLSTFAMIGDPANWPHVLSGEMDSELYDAFYFRKHGVSPTDKELPDAWDDVNFFKNNLRRMISTSIESEVKAEMRKEEMRNRQIIAEVREKMQAQSEYGTTAEISEKFNISKKQVRKMKRENRLHELFE